MVLNSNFGHLNITVLNQKHQNTGDTNLVLLNYNRKKWAYVRDLRYVAENGL